MDKQIKDILDNIDQPELITVKESASIYEASVKMSESNIGLILITNKKGKGIGVFSERDLLKKIVCHKIDVNRPVREFMTRDFISLKADEYLTDALNIMIVKQFRHIPIRDENDDIIYILSIRDLAGEMNPVEMVLKAR